MGIQLEADQAGKTGDWSAQTTDVDAEKEGLPVRCKAGEQQRSGHITDDLTGQQSGQILPAGQQILQQSVHCFDSCQISRKNEECHKGQQEHQISFQKTAPVEYEHRKYDHKKHNGPVQHPYHSQQAYGEQCEIDPQCFAVNFRFFTKKDMEVGIGKEKATAKDQYQG